MSKPEIAIDVSLKETDSEFGEHELHVSLSKSAVRVSQGNLQRPRHIKLISDLMKIIREYGG